MAPAEASFWQQRASLRCCPPEPVMEKENIVVAEDSSNAPPGPVPLKRVPPMMAEGEEGELHRIDELIRQLCSGSFCRGTSLSADAVALPENGNQLIMCACRDGSPVL